MTKPDLNNVAESIVRKRHKAIYDEGYKAGLEQGRRDEREAIYRGLKGQTDTMKRRLSKMQKDHPAKPKEVARIDELNLALAEIRSGEMTVRGTEIHNLGDSSE